jgi:lipoate-protein ligase A
MAQPWRMIDSGVGSAAWNMAVDEALLQRFKEGDTPILRFYGWESALTLGRFQTPHGSIDLLRSHRLGLPCVRRITGGGALMHGGDLSYALVLPGAFSRERGVKESYRLLCGFLIRLYEKLGLRADFAADLHLQERASPLCPAGLEAYDIVIGGMKMGGNAQRHTRDALFQHGSIPLRVDAAFFAPLFLEEADLERIATLERLGVDTEYKKVVRLAHEAFAEAMGAKLVPGSLREDEERAARTLLREKYEREAWNIDAQSEMA